METEPGSCRKTTKSYKTAITESKDKFGLSRLLPERKSNERSGSPSNPAFFRFLGAQSTDQPKRNGGKMDEPFSFDVWSETPPRIPDSKPDVEQMAQAMLSRLNSNPGNGLPANYNSHVFRVVQSHGELQHTIDDLNRKLEESELVNKRLRMQLDVLGSARQRTDSGASKASWEYLRDRFEHTDKSLLQARPSKLEKLPIPEMSPTKSPKTPTTISPKPSFGSGESVLFPSLPSLPRSCDELPSELSQSKGDGVTSSSANTSLQSGEILSTMYRLAGLMVMKRDISFHQAFYHIFKTFYGDSRLLNPVTGDVHHGSNTYGGGTDKLPALSELLEEACRLESDRSTPRPETNHEVPMGILPLVGTSAAHKPTPEVSDADGQIKSGEDVSHSTHSDSNDSITLGLTGQPRLTRSEGDLDPAMNLTYEKSCSPQKGLLRPGSKSRQDSPVRSSRVARFHFPFDWRSTSPKKFDAKQSNDGSEASASTTIYRYPRGPSNERH